LPKVMLTKKDILLAKTIMAVGATGSGKTTLLNSLVNKHFGI